MMTMRLLKLRALRVKPTRRHKFTIYVLINNKKTGFVRFFYTGRKNLTSYFCKCALTSLKNRFLAFIVLFKVFFYREKY